MHRYKLLKTKNGNNLVKAKLLLFNTNFAISNLSDQSSYYLLIKMQKCFSIS